MKYWGEHSAHMQQQKKRKQKPKIYTKTTTTNKQTNKHMYVLQPINIMLLYLIAYVDISFGSDQLLYDLKMALFASQCECCISIL